MNVNNTNNTCRICLETDTNTMINIFTKRDSGIISSTIMSITKVQIHPNDGLPNTLCEKCIIKLDTCIDFVRLCEKSDIQLRNTLTNSNTKGTNEIKLDVDESISEFNKNISLSNENCKSDELVLNKIDRVTNDISTCNKITQKKQCFKCGKIMSSSFRLKTHLATHIKDKPYSCPYCKKTFSLSQYLNVHLRVHTGEKPYSCVTCGESFAQSGGLAAHKRKHTGQTPYKCVLCPRSFRTVGHLQYHVRRHTGEKNFKCDTCSRAFITHSDLKQHLLTHTGVKLHVCCFCGLRCSRVSNLTRHMRNYHSEDKSYECSQCPLKFWRKNDLDKHEKTHISEIIVV